MLSTTGRKYLRGPRGTGLLYVRRTVLDQLVPPVLDLHAATWTARDRYEMRPDARRFETWEANYAAQLGLGAAIDYALGWGLPRIQRRVTALAESLRGQLAEIPGVRVRDLGVQLCGITTFTVEGAEAAWVRSSLAEQRIKGVGGSRYPLIAPLTASRRTDPVDRDLGVWAVRANRRLRTGRAQRVHTGGAGIFAGASGLEGAAATSCGTRPNEWRALAS
ncbi:pyridoxal-phosphate-dependent protein EgtE [Streptomyces jeddahensis]|uniref:Pyridoxal-phosphate-dependent protein EgtE n=1 Tax=Streptomyces jeddahensis TaxID=1716141 RepID=A0A177HPY6_9ACTN|nr:pyridoxal-phosphate-dependent protein EgtE [Streptomyces jeddahensis]